MKNNIIKEIVIILFLFMIFLFYKDYSLNRQKVDIKNQILMLKQQSKNYDISYPFHTLASYTPNIEKMIRYLYIKTSLEGIKFSIQQQNKKQPQIQQQNNQKIIKKQYIISFFGPIEQTNPIIKTLFFAFPVVLKKLNANKNNITITIDFYGKNDNRNNPS
jgi:hypothetical protein